jgi:peptide/nickel transport system permease protein
LPALWLVLTLVFLLIHLVPGDLVEQKLGEGAAPGQVEQLRQPWDSISRFMYNTATISSRSSAATWDNFVKFWALVRRVIFCEGYPASVQLAFPALVVCAAFAIPAGMLAAAAARRPTALSEGEHSVECQHGQDSVV